MNSQNQRETALIIAFPPPGARRSGLRAGQANVKQIAPSFEVQPGYSGGAWYHEAAILEADRSRKS